MNSNPLQLIVIGAGVGGYTAALRAASLGLRVTLIERSLIGGTCLNVGCIPTKALLESAKLVRLASHSSDFGVTLEPRQISLGKAVERSRKVVEVLRKGVEDLLRARGVEIVRGNARLLGEGRVEVDVDGERRCLEGVNIIVATGSSWISIPGAEPDGTNVITSDEALYLEEIPASMVIIGAGAVGCEFAEIYSAFGCQVTLVEMMDQILPGEDRELARRLEAALKRKRIRVLTSSRVSRVTKDDHGVSVEIEGAPSLKAAKVLVAVGRKPNLDGIGLGEVGIDYTRKGITTDVSMRTNVKRIYAIGDVTGNYMLAHVATKEALVAVETIAGRSASIDYTLVPRCVYTNPEYAAVGRTEQEAREQGYDVRVSRVRLGRIGRALTMGETFGLAKMVIDNSTNQLLGLQILAPHASEFITEATLALQQEASLEALASAIHPHPTLSEIVWETAQSALGKSIHGEDTS